MHALRIELLRSWRTFSLVLPLVVLCLVFAGILRGLGAAEGGLITLHSYTVGLLKPIAVLTSVYFPVCFAGAYLVKDLPQFSAVALLVLLILTLSALGVGSKKAQRPIRLG